jgi:hypothetical protein
MLVRRSGASTIGDADLNGSGKEQMVIRGASERPPAAIRFGLRLYLFASVFDPNASGHTNAGTICGSG